MTIHVLCCQSQAMIAKKDTIAESNAVQLSVQPVDGLARDTITNGVSCMPPHFPSNVYFGLTGSKVRRDWWV